MTREEFNEEVQSIRSNVGGYGNTKSSLEDIVYYADELEQHIAELEEVANGRHDLIMELSSQLTVKMLSELEPPKTCEGCKYSLDDGTSDHHSDMCKFCTRHGTDYYEPKDTE